MRGRRDDRRPEAPPSDRPITDLVRDTEACARAYFDALVQLFMAVRDEDVDPNGTVAWDRRPARLTAPGDGRGRARVARRKPRGRRSRASGGRSTRATHGACSRALRWWRWRPRSTLTRCPSGSAGSSARPAVPGALPVAGEALAAPRAAVGGLAARLVRACAPRRHRRRLRCVPPGRRRDVAPTSSAGRARTSPRAGRDRRSIQRPTARLSVALAGRLTDRHARELFVHVSLRRRQARSRPPRAAGSARRCGPVSRGSSRRRGLSGAADRRACSTTRSTRATPPPPLSARWARRAPTPQARGATRRRDLLRVARR